MEEKGSGFEAAVYSGAEEGYQVQNVAVRGGPLKPRVSPGVVPSSDVGKFF